MMEAPQKSTKGKTRPKMDLYRPVMHRLVVAVIHNKKKSRLSEKKNAQNPGRELA
jgi:hypothetical protein